MSLRNAFSIVLLPMLLGQPALLAGCSDDGETPETSVPPAELRPCEGLPDLPTAKCGSITVPFDREHPDAGTTTVAFVLVPRTDQAQPSLGTIVPNPGGPGDSTVNLVGSRYVEALTPILDRRDLLLIDPRGVGRSDPISCSALADPARVFKTVEEQRSAIGECGVQLGDRARYYGSAAVADDFDDVRAALGLDRLDLLGDSYGTFLMATYVQRHPEHVQSVVLSGAYAVNIDSAGSSAANAFRRAIGLVCERTAACSGETVLSDLAALAAQLRSEPVVIDVEFGEKTFKVTLDEWQLAGTAGKIYSSGAETETELALADAAAAARTGDLEPISELVRAHLQETAGYAVTGAELYSDTLNWATSCHDYPRDFEFSDSFADRKKDYDQMVANLSADDFAPFSPAAWVTRDNYDSGACLEWPDDPTAQTPFPPGTKLADVPVLVLAGDLDANTSSASGREAAAQFPNAEFIEVKNVGHTPTATPEGVKLVMEFIGRPRP